MTTNWSIRLRASLNRHVNPRLYAAYLHVDHSTFLSAGQGTTATTLVWYFYAIAKHPEAQARIREEIALVRARVDGEEFTVADLDSMVYTLATLKVVSDLLCACWLSLMECRSR